MTPIELAVLRFLADVGNATCTEIGETLFYGKNGRNAPRQAYARPAGKVVKRLVAAGLVMRVYPKGKEPCPARWGVTAKGRIETIRAESCWANRPHPWRAFYLDPQHGVNVCENCTAEYLTEKPTP